MRLYEYDYTFAIHNTLYTARSQCEDLVLENERLREQVSQQSYSYQIGAGEQENNENNHDGTCYSSPVVSQDGVIVGEIKNGGSTSRERRYPPPAGSISNSSCSPDAGGEDTGGLLEQPYYIKNATTPHHQLTTHIHSAADQISAGHRTMVLTSNRPSFYNSVRIQQHQHQKFTSSLNL